MKKRRTIMSIGQLFALLLIISNVALAAIDPAKGFIADLTVNPAIDSAVTQTAFSPLITDASVQLKDVLLRRQNVDCDSSVSSASSVASRSASAAIQQATQSAQQSIDAASRSITQAQQSAAQSASQAIQQAQQSASQQISAASQSANQVVNSANSVVSSVQSSASQAIASATSAQQAAQQSASSAIVQAGAAVAAATGRAAAAGSSFLLAAAKATQSAQASASAISAAAQAQISAAGQEVTASQVAAVTATQAAVAIVGSVIASSLLSILIYFLISRHRRRAAERKAKGGNDFQYNDSQKPFPSEKTPVVEVKDEKNPEVPRQMPVSKAPAEQVPSARFSLFPSPDPPREPLRGSVMKRTSLLWNPRKPPPAPTLGSWLRNQEVSPFNVGGLDLSRNDSVKSITRKPVASEQASIIDADAREKDMGESEGLKSMENIRWTDESVHSREEVKALRSPQDNISTGVTNLSQATTNVAAPIPILPRPSTAEWMKGQPDRSSASSSIRTQVGFGGRTAMSGLPRNPRMGLPRGPGPSGQGSTFGDFDRDVQDVYEARLGLRNAAIERNSNLSREGSPDKRAGTPGKAL